MGRIKTKLIKRVSLSLFHDHGDEFKSDFNENKQIVSKYAAISSPKLRNIIAGYVTRLTRSKD